MSEFGDDFEAEVGKLARSEGAKGAICPVVWHT